MLPQKLSLAGVVEKICAGMTPGDAFAEFVDGFDQLQTDQAKYSAIETEPTLVTDVKINALAGATAEYLAKQNRLGRVPPWTAGDARKLNSPWHTSSPFIDWTREYVMDGMREYLTFASPAEFASRNIFTEDRPLRRARGPAPGKADIV